MDPHDEKEIDLERSQWRVDDAPAEPQPVLMPGGGAFLVKLAASIALGLLIKCLLTGRLTGM
jgi:hypothetical protein